MKADGRGFHLSPDSFSALANCVEIAGHRWVIKKLTTPENYICHLVLPPETPVQVQYLEMAELLGRQQ